MLIPPAVHENDFRVRMTTGCRDADSIPKVDNAGQVIRPSLTRAAWESVWRSLSVAISDSNDHQPSRLCFFYGSPLRMV